MKLKNNSAIKTRLLALIYCSLRLAGVLARPMSACSRYRLNYLANALILVRLYQGTAPTAAGRHYRGENSIVCVRSWCTAEERCREATQSWDPYYERKYLSRL